MGGGGGAQRPVWRGNVPKKTGARSARARTRGQNPLVLWNILLELADLRICKLADKRWSHRTQEKNWRASLQVLITELQIIYFPAFFGLMYFIQLCFIGRPSVSIESENTRVEPRTVATLA